MREGVKFGDVNMVDSMIKDGLTDAFNNYHMGITGIYTAQMCERQGILRSVSMLSQNYTNNIWCWHLHLCLSTLSTTFDIVLIFTFVSVKYFGIIQRPFFCFTNEQNVFSENTPFNSGTIKAEYQGA